MSLLVVGGLIFSSSGFPLFLDLFLLRDESRVAWEPTAAFRPPRKFSAEKRNDGSLAAADPIGRASLEHEAQKLCVP